MSKTSEPPVGSPVDSGTLDAVFSALGHPSRRRILIVLHARGGRMTAGEINDRFKHSWPTTSRHLGVLVEAGVLGSEKQGRNRVYSLARGPLVEATDWLRSWAGSADAAAPADWAELPFATMRNAIPPEGGA